MFSSLEKGKIECFFGDLLVDFLKEIIFVKCGWDWKINFKLKYIRNLIIWEIVLIVRIILYWRDCIVYVLYVNIWFNW